MYTVFVEEKKKEIDGFMYYPYLTNESVKVEFYFWIADGFAISDRRIKANMSIFPRKNKNACIF